MYSISVTFMTLIISVLYLMYRTSLKCKIINIDYFYDNKYDLNKPIQTY